MNINLEKNFDYFLDHDFAHYEDGEWVAIYLDKIVSHGISLKNVIEEAKKIAPISQILLSKVKKTASYL